MSAESELLNNSRLYEEVDVGKFWPQELSI
jgi:hypothetical protein